MRAQPGRTGVTGADVPSPAATPLADFMDAFAGPRSAGPAGPRSGNDVHHGYNARMNAPNPDHRDAKVLAAVIAAAVDGIIVIDARGRIETFNPAAERLFGYRASEVIGRNVSVLMPAPYRDEHDEYLARYHRTGDHKIIGIGREVEGRRSDGTVFPLHLSVGEFALDGESKFVGILRDLTARVALEERVRERAALARLGEMAAVIAHEVRNPLAGIRGAVQVIGSRLPPDTRDAAVVGEILARIDLLNGLVQDLLLYARTPQPRPAATDVSALIAVTVDLLQQDMEFAGVQIEVDGTSPPIVGDAEMLKTVFQNLLVNAAHAAGGQGRVRVSVEASDVCRVIIADSGPGIPSEIRNKVFDPFFTTKVRGTGLGLPTARRLVEAHHGRIEIECPEGGGTRVIVELPLAGSPADSPVDAGPVLEPV